MTLQFMFTFAMCNNCRISCSFGAGGPLLKEGKVGPAPLGHIKESLTIAITSYSKNGIAGLVLHLSNGGL